MIPQMKRKYADNYLYKVRSSALAPLIGCAEALLRAYFLLVKIVEEKKPQRRRVR